MDVDAFMSKGKGLGDNKGGKKAGGKGNMKPYIVCYNCNKPGHMAAECWSKSRTFDPKGHGKKGKGKDNHNGFKGKGHDKGKSGKGKGHKGTCGRGFNSFGQDEDDWREGWRKDVPNKKEPGPEIKSFVQGSASLDLCAVEVNSD